MSPSPSARRGLFVTLEGGEGAGKSTLSKGLEQALQALGVPVCSTREPGATPLGALLRRLILEEKELKVGGKAELLLFLADRAQHVETKILPALERGELVLCDRFHDSTLAYQGGGRGFPKELLEGLCAFAAGGLQPDLTFFLRIAPDKAFQRLQRAQDRLEKEGSAFHSRVAEMFERLARESGGRIVPLDAEQPQDAVLREAMVHVERHLAARSPR